jgi:hypothetical protein
MKPNFSADSARCTNLGGAVPAVGNATTGAIQMKVELKVSRTVLSASSEVLHHPHVPITPLEHDCHVTAIRG